MKPFLMGAETEYAVSGTNGRSPVWPREIHTLLYAALQKERHWLADVAGGEALYLENAGRFYLDYGCHPEYATPECFTPAQVAAYDKAGERLLDLARQRVERERPGIAITVLKNNLSPLHPDDVTWGNHESYTSWVAPTKAAAALVPHLVSRTIYAGAGCLSGYARGMGFELSQRARHIHSTTGSDTTGDRALFCTRIRKVSDHSAVQGWTRAHLISKDSHRSPFGIYLTYGVTGLLFLMINEGHKVGEGLALEHPVEALRAISADPWLRTSVKLADGRMMTALEIQWSYLEQAERIVQAGSMPDWTFDVVRHWGETLAGLAKDPLRLARRLDPYYKLLVFDHELGRAGVSWSELAQALRELAMLHSEYAQEVVAAVLDETPQNLDEELRAEHDEAVERTGLKQDGRRERMRLALRLQQMELMYHTVGGLHDQLTTAGQLQRVVLEEQDVDRATREAPPGGRAAARSELIRQKRDAHWLCEWRYLYHPPTGEFLDLRNPFAGQAQSRAWSGLLVEQPQDADVQEILGQLGRR